MTSIQRYTELIIKYLDQSASVLIGYLYSILPKISDNWWEKTVVEKLTDVQKNTVKRKGIDKLDGLDIAALIRIFDMNWNEISQQYNLSFEDRNILKEMQAVRNRWSHKPNTGYNLEDIYRDFDTIQRFLKLIGAGQNIFEELKRVKMDIMKEISNESNNEVTTKNDGEKTQDKKEKNNNDEKLGRDESIKIINEKYSLNIKNSNTQYSSIHKSSKWGFDIDNSKFNEDFNIILDNQNEKILYYFNIKKGSIKDPKKIFYQRKDNTNISQIEFNDISDDFKEVRSGFQFINFLKYKMNY